MVWAVKMGYVDYVIKRVDQMKVSYIVRDRGRPKKTN